MQDAEYTRLIENVSSDFQGLNDLIVNPYSGLTPNQLRQYKSAAISAEATAEAMTLSDTYSKSRGLFVQGMNATITAVDTLDKAGKLSDSEGRVSTESVNVFFISSQNKIDDAFALIGLNRKV